MEERLEKGEIVTAKGSRNSNCSSVARASDQLADLLAR